MFSEHVNLSVTVNVVDYFIYSNSVKLCLYNHLHVKVFFSINFKLYITEKLSRFQALICYVWAQFVMNL